MSRERRNARHAMSERDDARGRGKRLLVAACVALVTFGVYNANGREIPSYDSQPAKYLAIEIAKRHTLALGYVVGRVPDLAARPGFARDLRGNYRSAYPLPSAAAAAIVATVLSTLRVLDLDAPLAPGFVAKMTASMLTALTVGGAFLLARRRLTTPRAVIVALGLGLGTNLWTGVSQTLWQQETAGLALMCAVFLLEVERPSVRHVVAVGVFLGCAGWARPQLAPTIVILMASIPVRWGVRGAVALIPILAAAAAAIWMNVTWFGHPLGAVPAMEALHPAVHGVRSSFAATPWLGAAGLLFSPSRGLLVFSPVVAIAAAGIGAALGGTWRSPLRWCLVAVLVQFLVYSMYSVWWGGHTYGPRYALDVLPVLFPLAVAGLPRVAGSRVLSALALLALAWSVAVAAAGAFIYPAERWNSLPTEVDRDHQRLWEWTDSQIPRTFRTAPSSQNFDLFSRDAVRRP